MAKHRWSTLCYRGSIDKYTNLISLLDVTDELTISELPESLPEDAGLMVNLQLVSLWRREHDEPPQKIWATFQVVAPNGEVFPHQGKTLEGNLESSTRTRLIFGVQAIPFRGAGLYWFDVLVTDSSDGTSELVDRVPLEIKVKQDATASPILLEQPSEPTPAAPRKSSSRRARSRP